MERISIPLGGKDACGQVTWIDEADSARVLARHWTFSQGYAVTGVTHRSARSDWRPMRLHRFLMGTLDGHEIDHINRNKLDNRRANLRWVVRAHNIANTPARNRSGVKGVYFDASPGRRARWVAKISIAGRHKTLGYFADAASASAAFEAVHRELYGDLRPEGQS